MCKKLKRLSCVFIVASIILLFGLVWRLTDQANMLRQFPLDFVNDGSSYMAQLYFMDKCGTHKFCPYWYNGFVTFKATFPGWYFFAYPLYMITRDVLSASYASVLLMYALGFVFSVIFGRKIGWSKLKSITFYFIFFANAIALGNFIRLGRFPELFAWLNFLVLAAFIFYYREHPINCRYFLTIIPTMLVIFSHQVVAVLSLAPLIGLFLIKTNRERLIIISAGALSLITASFWLVPYIKFFWQSGVVSHIMTYRLFMFDAKNLPENIATFLVPVALWTVFYAYYAQRGKQTKDLLFFLPALILSFLLFVRLTPFIPILKYVYPDPHMVLFVFYAGYLFLSIDMSKRIGRQLLWLFLLVCFISTAINFAYIPKLQEYNASNLAAISLLSEAQDRFAIVGGPNDLYNKAIYCYAPIYYNITTVGGWYPEVKEKSYIIEFENLVRNTVGRDCTSSNFNFIRLNTTVVLSSGSNCNYFIGCGWSLINARNNLCLLKLDKGQ